MKNIKLFENYVPDNWKKKSPKSKSEFVDLIGTKKDVAIFMEETPEEFQECVEKTSDTQIRIFLGLEGSDDVKHAAEAYGLLPVDLNNLEENAADLSKAKEIMNNVRNIMMMKPEMSFRTIMYNALDTTDFRELDDQAILKKLQKYELFLKDATK